MKERRRPRRGKRKVYRLTVLIVVGCLTQGCASHRRPPECKGPYTPINLSSMAYNGTQR
jgi:hypothetical protein